MGKNVDFKVSSEAAKLYGADIALLYGFMQFLAKKKADRQGCFAVSSKYIEECLGLTRHQQRYYFGIMIEKKLMKIESKLGKPSWYRVL